MKRQARQEDKAARSGFAAAGRAVALPGLRRLMGAGVFFAAPLAALWAMRMGWADTGGAVSFVPWHEILTPAILTASFIMASASAFFSASEVAYFSLQKVKVRTMGESGNPLARLAARHMDQPAALLATILMGNSVVNVLLGIVFAEPMAEFFERTLLFPTAQAYALSVASTTVGLVFFCEVLPKVIVVRQNAVFAQTAAIPLYLADLLIRPLRNVVMIMVGFLFRVTRFSELPPAPFLTDDEFKSMLEDGEASGVIEEDERQMIQGILEFGDKTVREILVPRPDIVAIRDTATVGEALATVREHEYSRMPVYHEGLDHIVGVLYAKDLLPLMDGDAMDAPIAEYMRRAHFVPETMTLAHFMKLAQRLHSHISIVVDEYGGTRGLVTLQDALREVVGDLGDDDEGEDGYCVDLGEGAYRVDGSFTLVELETLVGITVDDEEHTTVGGFLMAETDKILQVGDEIVYSGVRFCIEQMAEKRVVRVLIQCLPPAEPGEAQP